MIVRKAGQITLSLITGLASWLAFRIALQPSWAQQSDDLSKDRELVEHRPSSVDQPVDQYSQVLLEYKQTVSRRIGRAWSPPRDGGSAVVRFNLSRTGETSNLSVLSSSGFKMCDEAALRAVTAAQPFAIIPMELPAPLVVVFDFHFTNGLKVKGISLFAPSATSTKSTTAGPERSKLK